MSLESFIIVPGLVIFRNMMLFLSGQFSWVKSKQATKYRQKGSPLALPVGCLYSIVCLYTLSSAAALCSLASSCPAKPDLTQAHKLPLHYFLATASKSAERKKNWKRQLRRCLYVYEVRVCCFGFTWPEHFYYDDGSVKVKHSKRRSEPSFCIITPYIVVCFCKRALQATRPNKHEIFFHT